MKSKQIAVIAVPAVIAVAGLSYWLSSGTPEPVIEETVTTEPEPSLPQPIIRREPEPVSWERPEPTPEPAPEPEVAEPLLPAPTNLDDSDSQVHELVKVIAPPFGKWLLPQQQIRKWTATVDMMAEGRYPRKYPAIDFPLSKFKVEKHGEQITQSSSNFQRADLLIDTLTAIDPKLLATYYQAWQPIFEKAYREQGKPDRFDDRLRLAIDRIIALETLPENTELKRPHVFYTYADPELEKRSDLEKLVWRLGTENQQQLQTYLKQLKPLL